jgi:choline dehydrogenase-like flavoprotein
MSVSYDKPVIAVTNELAEFPYQRDMNGGNPIGIGWTQFSITNGQRTDSNSAYIQPFLKRPNLTVLTGARATRVLQTGSVRGAPVFRGVEFAASATGERTEPTVSGQSLMLLAAPRISVVARKEVVLSAGSFNTPQLLMLSGIGDPTDLRAAGIRPLVALPSVGRNMTDHVRLANKFQANVTDTVNNWALPANFAPALAQWKKTRTGPLTDPGFSQIGWLRVPDDDELLEAYPDPSTGPTSAHFELVFVVRH